MACLFVIIHVYEHRSLFQFHFKAAVNNNIIFYSENILLFSVTDPFYMFTKSVTIFQNVANIWDSFFIDCVILRLLIDHHNPLYYGPLENHFS